ncbi:MAG TPA: type VI secretion system baseplate subunit TssF, partial [Polyangiaceae bacterium]
PCRFRTTSEVRVGPWRVEGTRVERPAEGAHSLRFELVATGDLSLAEAIGSLRPRFFVGGSEAMHLVAHVLAHTARAELAVEDEASPVALGEVAPFGTRAEHALAPEPDGPHTGMSLLREYFLLPEKFSFFALGGLAAALRSSSARRATVSLTFDEPLPAPVIAPVVRAHCVAAVNLFAASAEPWVFEPGRSSAAVRVAGLRREEAGVYAVAGVRALARDEEDSQPSDLPPVRRFAATRVSADFPYGYSTKLAPVGQGGEPEVVLCLTVPRGHTPSMAAHVVSADLLATNRARAGRLRPGELCEPGRGIPPGVQVRNITSTSPYVPAPEATELALQVAVHAAVPDGDPLFALRSRLLALVPRRALDAASVRAHVTRIRSLEGLQVVTALDRAQARRGYEARLTIDETPFAGLGDVALFVRLLSIALEAQVSIGHFVRCTARCTKSSARIIWPPESRT